MGEFEQSVKELFQRAFIENCDIDDEEVTPEEMDTLVHLKPTEVLDNFGELLNDLLVRANPGESAHVLQRLLMVLWRVRSNGILDQGHQEASISCVTNS